MKHIDLINSGMTQPSKDDVPIRILNRGIGNGSCINDTDIDQPNQTIDAYILVNISIGELTSSHVTDDK